MERDWLWASLTLKCKFFLVRSISIHFLISKTCSPTTVLVSSKAIIEIIYWFILVHSIFKNTCAYMHVCVCACIYACVFVSGLKGHERKVCVGVGVHLSLLCLLAGRSWSVETGA